jgi:hypothetical protein
MFEKALITRVGDVGLDLGLLAETVLFYGSTQLLLNRGSISSLATDIPADDLLALFDRSNIRLSYLRPSFAVSSAGPFGKSNFVAMTFEGRDPQRKLDHREEIEEVLARTLGRSEATRKLTKSICDRVALHRFKNVQGGENIIVELTKRDVAEPGFAQSAAKAVLQNFLPIEHVPKNFKFELVNTGDGYLVDTDLDFKAINEVYHRFVPPSHSTLNEALILAYIILARSESYFACEYMSEIVTSAVYSDIMRLRHFDVLLARDQSSSKLAMFTEIAIPGVPSVREAMNSKDRSMRDFIALLDEADKFRSFLNTANPDEELLARYIRAITEKTWADNLPTKGMRFVLATGAGLLVDLAAPTGIGTFAGIGVGAADSLYLDHYLKGWKPNQFIEGPYKEFVSVQGKI